MSQSTTFWSVMAFVALVAIAGAQTLQEVDRGRLVVRVGGEIQIVGDYAQWRVENLNVAEVTSGEGGLLARGLAPGVTGLRLWPAATPNVVEIYSVEVSANGATVSAPREEIETLIGGMFGVKVLTVGDRLVLEGTVYRSEDRSRLDRIVAEYDLLDLTRDVFNEKEAQEARDRAESIELAMLASVRDDLQRLRLPGVEAELRGVAGRRMLLLTGVAPTVERHQALTRLAGSYFSSEATIDLIDVEPPTITIEARFIAVSERDGLELPDFGAGGDPIVLSETTRSRLKDAGQILFRASQTTRGGETALFHQGGELVFPPQAGGAMARVEYGTSLEVTPVARPDGQVALTLTFENSAPAPRSEFTPEGVATLSRFRAEAAATIQIGETLAIAVSKTRRDLGKSGRALRDSALDRGFATRSTANVAAGRAILLITPRMAVGFQASDDSLGETAREHRDRVVTEQNPPLTQLREAATPGLPAARTSAQDASTSASASVTEQPEPQRKRRWWNPTTW